MSGSSSDGGNVPNGGGSGFGGGGGGADDCSSLSVRTTLNSPKLAVLGQLKPGDILTVQLRTPTGPAVVVAIWNGQEAGSITSSVMLKLIQCLQDEAKFIAEVTSIQGGSCEVHVRPASAK